MAIAKKLEENQFRIRFGKNEVAGSGFCIFACYPTHALNTQPYFLQYISPKQENASLLSYTLPEVASFGFQGWFIMYIVHCTYYSVEYTSLSINVVSPKVLIRRFFLLNELMLISFGMESIWLE